MDERRIFDQPTAKRTQLFLGPFYRGVDFLCSMSYGNQVFSGIVYSFVEPNYEITSDPRQDGQSSLFITSSSQKGQGMRTCRAFIVAGREKNPPSKIFVMLVLIRGDDSVLHSLLETYLLCLLGYGSMRCYLLRFQDLDYEPRCCTAHARSLLRITVNIRFVGCARSFQTGLFRGSCRTVNGEGQFLCWVDSFHDSGM